MSTDRTTNLNRAQRRALGRAVAQGRLAVPAGPPSEPQRPEVPLHLLGPLVELREAKAGFDAAEQQRLLLEAADAAVRSYDLARRGESTEDVDTLRREIGEALPTARLVFAAAALDLVEAIDGFERAKAEPANVVLPTSAEIQAVESSNNNR